MASLEEILKMPVSQIKAPQALPIGKYHCIVDGPPTPGKSSQKGTDYLQFKYKIIAPLDGVDMAAAAEQQVVGKTITCDYYITDNATWRAVEMLVDHLGIEPGNGASEKKFEELVAEAPSKQLIVVLKHELSQDGKRVFHRVANTEHV